MGAWLLLILLLHAAIRSADGGIVCATCSDRIIRYNWDLMPFLRVPGDWPGCDGTGVSGKESNTPILLSHCEHSCISIDWIRGQNVSARFRGCSTDLLRGDEAEHANSNVTMLLSIYEQGRYGLEIHPKLCFAEMCNFDNDIYHEALWPTVVPEDLSSEEPTSSEEVAATLSTDSPSSVPDSATGQGAATSTEKYMKHRYYTVPTETSFEDVLMDVLTDYESGVQVDPNDLMPNPTPPTGPVHQTEVSPTTTESSNQLKTLSSIPSSAKQPTTPASSTSSSLNGNNPETGQNETIEIFTKVEKHMDRIHPLWGYGRPEYIYSSCALPMISFVAAVILLI